MTKNTKKQNGRNVTEEFRRAAAKRVYNNQKSKAGVARELGIPESTLRGWCNKYKKEMESEMELPGEPAAKRAKVEAKEGGKGEPQKQHPEALLDLSQTLTPSPKSTTEELARVGRELGLNQPEIFISNNNNNNNSINFSSINQIYEILSTQPKTLEEERVRNYIICWLAMQQPSTNIPKDRKSPITQSTHHTTPSQRNINGTPHPKTRSQYKATLIGSPSSTNRMPEMPATTTTTTTATTSTGLNFSTSPVLNVEPLVETPPTSRNRTPSPPRDKMFWRCYKKVTRDSIDESVSSTTESFLRNLLRYNESGVASISTPCTEIVKSGEQFLSWMLSPENSLVTASERMMMVGMLERVKNATLRKNGVLESEAKSGRKSYVPMKILRAV